MWYIILFPSNWQRTIAIKIKGSVRKEGHYICVFQTDRPWFSCATLQGRAVVMPHAPGKRLQCYKELVLLGHGGSLESLVSMPIAQHSEPYKYLASSRLFGEVLWYS